MNSTEATLIRPFESKDLEGFHSALDTVARERRYLTLLQAPPIEECRLFVEALLENNSPQFVALSHDKVVGWCDIKRLPFQTHAHRGGLGMGILASHRGKGIGLRLIQAAIAKAKQVGIKRIELGVHADNIPALSLYEKVGFVVEGTARDAVCIDGEYIDVINMALVDR
ncbi:MAG: GNAT family N-acetyltransferase [Phyllobacterium sp.]